MVLKNKLFWIAPTGADLSIKSSTGVSKTLNYHTEDYAFYSGCHDFTINMDYSEEAVTSVTITFPSASRNQYIDSYCARTSLLCSLPGAKTKNRK